MKYEILYEIVARMVIEVDTPEEAEEYFNELGNTDYPFRLNHPESVEGLELEEFVDVQ